MKTAKLVFSSIILLFGAASLNAQKPRLFDSEYGLPNSKVTSVIQDTKGFIWVASEGGIARFDGVDFTSFDNHAGESGRYSIGANILYEDSRGTFWIGTPHGLQIFNQKLNTFDRFDFNDPEATDSDLYIHYILEVPEDNGKSLILVSASQHGIYVIDADSHELDSQRRGILASLPGFESTNKIFLDSKGRLWMASEFGGISVVDKKTLKPVDIGWDLERPSMKEDILVNSFIEDSVTGNICIGTSNNGILVFEGSKMRIRQA
ncbi:MAG: two-component regulator propeller domain-containing protein, partial [Bacteroidia bacterium]|nr:two-component regulator propeller domain-containing protein [Bacteroidia bacterium]